MRCFSWLGPPAGGSATHWGKCLHRQPRVAPALASKHRDFHTLTLEPRLRLPGYHLCIYIFTVTTPILVIH